MKRRLEDFKSQGYRLNPWTDNHAHRCSIKPSSQYRHTHGIRSDRLSCRLFAVALEARA